MKKLIVLLFVMMGISSLFSYSLCATSSIASPVSDLVVEDILLQNFGILKQSPENAFLGMRRLDELKASGSGQFSESTFADLLNTLSLQSEKLIICDLREDCHGFVNGLPVHWIDESQRFDSLNRRSEEIELEEYERLRIAVEGSCTWVEGDNGIKLIDSQVVTERALVEGNGYLYVRFPVTNCDWPNDQLVDQFISFIQCLSADDWVHFHCQTGKERTTMFLILLDIIRNAQQVSLEDILAKHERLGEFGSEENLFREESRINEQEKYHFLCEFYAYCRQVPDFSISWSEWLEQQMMFMNTEVLEALSNKSCLMCHADKGWGGRMTVERTWGGSDEGGKWKGTAEVNARDGKGNYVEGTASQRSDGTKCVGISVGRDV